MKNKIILSLIFFGLGLIFFIIAFQKEELPENYYFIQNFTEEQAVSWEIKWDDIIIEAIKKNNIWYLEKPYKLIIDQGKADSMIKNFLYLEVKDSVQQEKKISFKNSYSISFKQSDGKIVRYSFRELDFLKDLDLFLIEHQNQKYLVEKWFLLGFKKKPEELFPASIFSIDPTNIDTIITPEFSFKKKADGWRITNQEKQPKNFKKLDDFALGLAYLKSNYRVLNKTEIKKIRELPSKKFSIITKNKDNVTKQILFSLYSNGQGKYLAYEKKIYLLENNQDNFFFDYTLEEILL